MAWHILQVTQLLIIAGLDLCTVPLAHVCKSEQNCNMQVLLYLRHTLAVLHFNENLNRQPKTTKNGRPYYSVTYPKFKLGEEVVRTVSSAPSYSKYLHDDAEQYEFYHELVLKSPTEIILFYLSRLC